MRTELKDIHSLLRRHAEIQRAGYAGRVGFSMAKYRRGEAVIKRAEKIAWRLLKKCRQNGGNMASDARAKRAFEIIRKYADRFGDNFFRGIVQSMDVCENARQAHWLKVQQSFGRFIQPQEAA